MKRNKILAVTMAICMMGLASCGNVKIEESSKEPDITSSIESFNHVHTPGKKIYDDSCHYQACAECGEKMGEGEEHTMCDISINPATCLTPGHKTSICSDCDYKVETEIAPKGHRSDKYKATDGGHYKKCDECGTEFEQQGHDFVVVSETESTCSVAGKANEKCRVCNFERTTDKALVEHTWSCVSTGGDKHQLECEKCGTHSAVEDHKFVKVSETDSTCTVAGQLVEKCSECGQEKTTAKELLNHTWGYVSMGTEHQEKCTVCGALGEKSAHTYVVSAEKDPTCTEGGYSESVCSLCNATNRVTADATGHSLIAVDNEDGTHKVVCLVCNEVVTASVEHKLQSTVLQEPSSQSMGKTMVSCEECDYQEVVLTEHTGAHIYTNSLVYVDNSVHGIRCTIEGCNYGYNYANHVLQNCPIKYPTETEPGLMGKMCWRCYSMVESGEPEEFTGTKIESLDLDISFPRDGQKLTEGFVLNTTLPAGVRFSNGGFRTEDGSIISAKQDYVFNEADIDNITEYYFYIEYDYFGGVYPEFTSRGAPNAAVMINGYTAEKPFSGGSCVGGSKRGCPYWCYSVYGDDLAPLLRGIHASL
ncbi:MAG: hypothetical protein MJ241_06660 [Bacilli bacterium]|nr:hypothetical protein [Bacilli bacterium]